MKFSDFNSVSWEENGHYYDTCLIPFTGLTGQESPPQTVERLEKLRDYIDRIERPFRGRIVVYPAVQYDIDNKEQLINEICHNVKSSNFRYAIVLDAGGTLIAQDVYESDLPIAIKGFFDDNGVRGIGLATQEIQRMWQKDMNSKCD
ncbi:DUF2487 family protein [Paenibacillus durus]|uniref:DUF2487 domain-containing protein n=1 Tax=Paenibacillus durus ATCC 35681 TaxID=1333534 RepID=A0A0F7CIK2_PAEDU|nr:DUF2487 family protein [Paenibacillus durus]AKG35396.1 hypothetical protein VK70_13105 [Paenibacillus durus ATCC 35681]